jgi:amino acid permease
MNTAEIISLICLISIPVSLLIWGGYHIYKFEGYEKSDKRALIIAIIELFVLMIGAIIVKIVK